MTDYECPDCGGGFPAADSDGACPWCGEKMAGDNPTTPDKRTIGAVDHQSPRSDPRTRTAETTIRNGGGGA